MPAVDLLSLYQSSVAPLPRPQGDSLAGVLVPGLANHRLAKDANDCPCFLIGQRSNGQLGTPIRLQNLRIVFGASCVIRKARGNEESGTFTIVRCIANKPDLLSSFLQAMSPIAVSLGDQPTDAQVQQAISRVVELFRSLAAAPRKLVQGLWGELLLIRDSRNVVEMAAAWHSDPDERFDFSVGRQRLEVKTSSQRRRRHHFSLEQLTATAQTEIIVASIFVERSGGGTSVRQLANAIRTSMSQDTDAMIRFDRILFQSLGSDHVDWIDEGFDLQLARGSLACFSSIDVPKVANPFARVISEVRFCSELDGVPVLTESALRERGGLFAQIR